MQEIDQTSYSTLLPMDSDQTHPWLLISQGNNLQNHAFYSISKNNVIKRNVPEFHNKVLSATSYHGWLALIGAARKSRSHLDCCLLNTSTREKLQLPNICIQPESSWSYKCILSKPPTDPNCRIMLFPTAANDPVLYCRLGDKKFGSKNMGYGPSYTSTDFGGKVYVCMNDFKIMEVDFVDGDIALNELVDPVGEPLMIDPPTNFSRSYMVDCCGELLLVTMIYHWNSEEIAYITIFKINITDKEVSELKSIGNRVIFLGLQESTSIMCTAEDSLLKMNSIYYISEDKFLYVYDIEDRSKTLIKVCPIKRHTNSMMSWIMM